MKKLFICLILSFVLFSSFNSYAADNDEIITSDNPLFDSLLDKWIALSSFGDQSFSYVKDLVYDALKTDTTFFVKTFTQLDNGLDMLFYPSGSGWDSIVSELQSLNSEGSSLAPGWYVPDSSRTFREPSFGYVAYFSGDCFLASYGSSASSGSLIAASFNNNFVLSAYRNNSLYGTYSPTLTYSKDGKTLYYVTFTLWRPQSINVYPIGFASAAAALDALIGYSPNSSFQAVQPISYLSSSGLGSDWSSVYNNNYQTYLDGTSSDQIFYDNSITYNYTYNNSYNTKIINNSSFDDMASDTSERLNLPVEVPDVDYDFSFVTQCYNILPGELKAILGLGLSLTVSSFLFGFGGKGL